MPRQSQLQLRRSKRLAKRKTCRLQAVEQHKVTNSSSGNYQFAKLQHPDSIRILHLQPGHSDTAIHATLGEERMEAQPVYEAISYTWGEPIFSETLYIDGLPFHITSNLHNALVQFRHFETIRRLWVDAICINQKDDNEKGHQLHLMAKIYSEAERVLVWLGAGTEETDMAMRGLEQFLIKAKSMGIELSSLTELYPRHLISMHSISIIRGLIDFAKSIKLHALYSRPWFRRLWVVQELALARSALITCGNSQVNCESFASAMKLLNEAYMAVLSIPPELDMFQHAGFIFTIKYLLQGGEHSSFLKSRMALFLLQTCESRECSDQRDRVHALRGLLSANYGLEPLDISYRISDEYTMTVCQVYRKFTVSFYENKINEGLYYAGLFARSQAHILEDDRDPISPDYLPSWALDLRPLKVSSGLPANLMYSGTNKEEPLLKLRSDGMTLEVKGIPWDTINVVFPPRLESDDVREIVQAILEVIRLIITNNSHAGQSALAEVIACKLLLLDGKSYQFERRFTRKLKPKQILDIWALFDQHFLAPAGELSRILQNMSEEDFERDILYTLRPDVQDAYWCYQCVKDIHLNSQFFVTDKFYLGLAPRVPHLSLKGAEVVIFAGAGPPYIVIPHEQDDKFELVGPCYLYGIMDGEATSPEPPSWATNEAEVCEMPWKMIPLI